MTTLTHEFLERCEGLRPVVERAWGQSVLGRRSDRGPVLAATQSTGQADYATGDDFRHVDWNRAARLDELVVRQFRGVETGVVELVFDQSASMSIGSPTKFALAQQLAAALGYFALAAGRQVRLEGVPAFTGRRDAPAMLRAVEALSPDGEETALNAAVSVARRMRRGDMTVVLSDLLDPAGLESLIEPFARPAEQLLIVQVLAAEDLEPSCLDRLDLRDVENGHSLSIELWEEDLATYRATAAEFCRDVRRFCATREIRLVQLRTDIGFERSLEHLIQVTAMQPAGQH